MRVRFDPYPDGWKAVIVTRGPRPANFKQWVNFLWGFDFWAGPVPLLKSFLALYLVILGASLIV